METILDNDTADSFDQYLALIADYVRVLTPEEEHDLVCRVALGDREARKLMIMHNQRLTISIAKVYLPKCPGGMMDLVSEGNLGLIHALEKFDPDRRDEEGKYLKFSTYATWWIRQAILRYIRRMCSSLHIPNRVDEEMYMVRQKRTILGMQLGREATLEEIAAAVKLSVEKVKELLALDQVHAVSIDDLVAGESEMTILDVIPDTAAAAAYEEVDEDDSVRTWLAILTPQEREVITSYFGLCGHSEESFREIARRRECSPQNVNLLYHRAMKRLRSHVPVKTA